MNALLMRICLYGVAALALSTVLYGKGYIAGVDHQTDRDRAAQTKVVDAAIKQQQALIATGRVLSEKLWTSEQLAKKRLGQDLQEVHVVTTHIETINGKLETVPPPRITNGTVCLYNRHFSGATGSEGASGSDAEPCGTGVDAQSASSYDEADWLATDLENADLCWSNIRKLTALQEWERARERQADHGHH